MHMFNIDNTKLQALVRDTLLPTTAIVDYATSLEKTVS